MNLSRPTFFSALAIVFAAVSVALPMNAAAQSMAEGLPPQLESVGITERLNEQLPLDSQFNDETGKSIRLSELITPGRPVILTLNFFRCPMLCNLTLNGLVEGLKEIEWSAGKEFDIITVSFNPDEGPELAGAKKLAYLDAYQRPTAEQGWRFLTGDQANIDALCTATGFGYRKLADDDFAHTSTIMFLTPDGRLSRYMNDVVFKPRDLKFALIEASQGSIGSPMDKFLLFMCFHYDPKANSYAASAQKLMRLGGAATVLALAAGLGALWLRGSGGRASGVHTESSANRSSSHDHGAVREVS